MMTGCRARQMSDQMVCNGCGQAWDMNDPDPPACMGGSVKPVTLNMPIRAAIAAGALGGAAKVVFELERMISEAEARRPGIRLTVREIQQRNLHISPLKALEIAKQLYDAPTISVYVDGPLVIIPNALYKGDET